MEKWNDHYEYRRKIMSREELVEKVKQLHKYNKTIVFTNGCFDIVHMGHVSYLRKSKLLGDVLIVALNSDLSIKALKGNGRPVITEKGRAGLLEAFDFVDYITVFGEETPLQLIQLLKPDVYTKGGDYNYSNLIGPGLGADIIESYGGRAVIIPAENVHSTSQIINDIREQYGSSGLQKIERCSDNHFSVGKYGVKDILATKDKKVEFIIFDKDCLAYVNSIYGHQAYYPVFPTELKKPVRAVLMDLDGTTVKSEQFWIYIIQKTIAKITDNKQFEFEDSDIPYISGHSVSEHLSYAIQKYCPEHALSDAVNTYFEITHDEMEKIKNGRGNTGAFVPREGMKEFLFKLKEKKIKIALVTSGLYEKAYPEILSAFKFLGLGRPEEYYDCIITAGYPLKRGSIGTMGELSPKPHPWLYAEACSIGLGMSWKERNSVIGIEDSGAGICSVKLAGYVPIGIEGGNIIESGTKCLCHYYGDLNDILCNVIND